MTPQKQSWELEQRLIKFAVRIVRLTRALPKDFAGIYFGKQVLRSGSSPALHYGEARSAESKKDFRHKCSIALKELRETHINLRIVEASNIYSSDRLTGLIDENNQLISIFVKTVRSIDENHTHSK